MKPVLIAFVPCERAEIGSALTLHRVINELNPGAYPFSIAIPVYIAVTDCAGGTSFRVEIRDAATDNLIGGAVGKFRAIDPVGVASIVADIPAVTFQQPGPCIMSLYVAGEYMVGRRINVV